MHTYPNNTPAAHLLLLRLQLLDALLGVGRQGALRLEGLDLCGVCACDEFGSKGMQDGAADWGVRVVLVCMVMFRAQCMAPIPEQQQHTAPHALPTPSPPSYQQTCHDVPWPPAPCPPAQTGPYTHLPTPPHHTTPSFRSTTSTTNTINTESIRQTDSYLGRQLRGFLGEALQVHAQLGEGRLFVVNQGG